MGKVVRAALYERVSHEDSAKDGYSLEAQRDDLIRYSERNGYKIVDHYVDAGITARKDMNKRNEFQRLMDDVRAGKIDTIVFIKLDRWFRNIAHYYKIQEILEANDCEWECSQDEFTTKTREGRLKINLFLMIAQDEADRASERIKFVFEHKIREGHAISGSQPFGLCVKPDSDGIKRVVKDKEVEKAVYLFLEEFKRTHSVRKATSRVYDELDVDLSYDVASNIIKKEIYSGRYKGNPEYIKDPYMSPEEQDELRHILKNNRQKKNTKRSYLFSGLINCPHCGRKMAAGFSYAWKRKYEYRVYRCNRSFKDMRCDFRNTINEEEIEQYLLDNLETELSKFEVMVEKVEETLSENRIDVDKKRERIKNEMKRLNEMYKKGRIETEEEYDKEWNELQEQLTKLEQIKPPKKKDFSELKKMIGDGFKEAYELLSPEGRKSFWLQVLESIEVDDEKNVVGVVFKGWHKPVNFF